MSRPHHFALAPRVPVPRRFTRPSGTPTLTQAQFEYEESQRHLGAHHPWVHLPVSELQEEYDRSLRRSINGNATTKEKVK
jgi:hypothetical protein